MMDKRPDVDCGGEGGLAGVRMVADGTTVAIADGPCGGSRRSASAPGRPLHHQRARSGRTGRLPGAVRHALGEAAELPPRSSPLGE